MKEFSFNEIRDFKDSVCRKRDRAVQKDYLKREKERVQFLRKTGVFNFYKSDKKRLVGREGDNLSEFFNESISLEKKC